MKDKIAIKKMIEYCDNIYKIMDNISYNTFEYDSSSNGISRRFGCAMCLQQIGELANTLSDDLKLTHNTIDWDAIISLRHKIVHHYKKIKYSRVWYMTQNDIPKLIKDLEIIIKKLG